MCTRAGLFGAAMVALMCTGADWLQFRGPGGSGISDAKNLPVTWSSKENIVWRTKMPGPGTSCPIVVGRRVYLTAYSGYGLEPGEGEMNDLMRHLICVNRDSGDVMFTRNFKPVLPESEYRPGNDGEHGYASSTPASDGKRLYLFFGKSGVICTDMDGQEIWTQSVGTNVTGWGSSNSPILHKDLVIVNASIECGSLVALDKNSGKERWRVKGIGASWNTPVLVDAPDGVELVLNESKAVIGFDPDDGKELWRVKGFSGYVCPSVVAEKGIVYVVRGETLAIKAGGRGDVTETHVLWRGKGNSLVPSPVVYDGLFFWAYGQAHCLDAKTGKEIYRERAGGDYYASALLADGKLYCVTRRDGVYVLAAGPKFQQLAHNKFEDDNSRTNASPIAHDRCILLRTDQYLYCIGKR